MVIYSNLCFEITLYLFIFWLKDLFKKSKETSDIPDLISKKTTTPAKITARMHKKDGSASDDDDDDDDEEEVEEEEVEEIEEEEEEMKPSPAKKMKLDNNVGTSTSQVGSRFFHFDPVLSLAPPPNHPHWYLNKCDPILQNESEVAKTVSE